MVDELERLWGKPKGFGEFIGVDIDGAIASHDADHFDIRD